MKFAIAPETTTTLLLLLALAVAGSVFWVVGELVELPFKQAGFPSRFPEKEKYEVDRLIALAANKSLSSYYRSPVLFPADLLVMTLLAGAMAAASYHWLGYVKSEWAWAGLLFPAAYFLVDLAEDCLLFRMLGDPGTIKDQVDTLVTLTRAKFATIIISGAQTAVLLVAYLIAAWRGAAG